MSGFPDLTSVYKVTIANVVVDRGCCITKNPRVLLGRGSRRGGNLVIPRADGELPLPRKLGGFSDMLQLVFVGDVTSAGVASATPRKTLLENFDWFDSNIYRATPGADNCVSLRVDGPDGYARVGRIQLLSFDIGDNDRAAGLTTANAGCRFVIPKALTSP